MAGDQDRRKSILNQHHMRGLQCQIDSEYQTYLRRQERDREQAERMRERHTTSLNTLLSHSSKYVPRNYARPWLSGMASKSQFAGSSGIVRDREPQSTSSKLPTINKDPRTARKKTASTLKITPDLQPQAAMMGERVREPRFVVQKKRLHACQLPAALGTKDRGEEWSKCQTKTSNHQSLLKCLPAKQHCLLKQGSTYSHQDRLPRSDPVKVYQNGPRPSVLPSLHESPSSSNELQGISQSLIPSSANPMAAPWTDINDCFNALLERKIEDRVEDDEDVVSLDLMDEEGLPNIREPPFPDFERDVISWRADMDNDSPEESEDNGSKLSGGTRCSNEPSTQRNHVDSCPTDTKEEIRNEGTTNVQLQDSGTDSSDVDHSVPNREETPMRPSPGLIVSPISHRRPQRIIFSPPIFDNRSLNISQDASLDLLSESDESEARALTRPGANNASPVPVLDTTVTPSHAAPAHLPNYSDSDLQHIAAGSALVDRSHSVADPEPSSLVPYLGSLAANLPATAPSLEVLRENLHLIFLTLSMRRPLVRRNSGRIQVPAQSQDKPKADPEKLRQLQDSLLEEDSDEEEGDICRICLMGGSAADNSLIAPCQCSGSLKYVHQECLKKWLTEKITSGAELEVVKTCEMCKQNVESQMDGFNLNEQYREHQESQQGTRVDPSLYLMLLLHMYEQRFEELLRLTHTRDQVTEISRRISHLRTARDNRDDPPDPDPLSSHQIN